MSLRPVEGEEDQDRSQQGIEQADGGIIDQAGLDREPQGFPVADLQPLAVVDEQEDPPG